MNHPFQNGDAVNHSNRGPCVFIELDAADPSGDTAWVKFEAEDEECMVTTSLLLPWWPVEKGR